VLTSLMVGALLGLVIRKRGARLFGVVTYAVLAGLAGAAVLHWLGALSGNYVTDAGAVGLMALAVAGAVAGLGALLGAARRGCRRAALFVVGNPISGVAAAPELLPKPWGEVGQWLPPGAGATLLRSVSFFDGAGGMSAAWVLGGWAVVGLLLIAVSRSPGEARPNADRVGGRRDGDRPRRLIPRHSRRDRGVPAGSAVSLHFCRHTAICGGAARTASPRGWRIDAVAYSVAGRHRRRGARWRRFGYCCGTRT
jgi:hypothetical protein